MKIKTLFSKKKWTKAVAALTTSIALMAGSSHANAATVDLLVLYDDFSNNFFSGDVQTAMNSWVAQVNSAYSDSQVDIQIRLVGVRPHNQAGADMSAVLNNLWRDSKVIQLRDQLGADFVSQLHQTGNCGVGFMAVDAGFAFNVVGPSCGALVMAHELGHNMGLNHSRKQGNTQGAWFEYALGYGVDLQFGTIMTYPWMFNAGSARTSRFSNPNILCKGLPCGVPTDKPDSAYAAKALNNVKDILASFRPTVIPVTSSSASSSSAPSSNVATMYQHCWFDGWSTTGLEVGSYNLAALQAHGFVDNDVSSIQLAAGYEAVLYQGDNFTGALLLVNADDNCFVNEGFNDNVTSVIVRAIGQASSSSQASSDTSVSSSSSSSLASVTSSRQSSSATSSSVVSSVNSSATSSVSSVNNFNITIQAENYVNSFGVQTEGTSDVGGGLNVGWLDSSDWLAYNAINIPVAGTYTVELRVANNRADGAVSKVSFDLNAGQIPVAQFDIPHTGGWQNWITVTKTVQLPAGNHRPGMFSVTAGWNINWFRIKQ